MSTTAGDGVLVSPQRIAYSIDINKYEEGVRHIAGHIKPTWDKDRLCVQVGK